MAVKLTGQLSLKNDIAAAAGDTVAPFHISDYAGYSDGIPTTGRLGLRRFYGQPKRSSWTWGSTKHNGVATTTYQGSPSGLSVSLGSVSGNSGSSTLWESIDLSGKLSNFVGQTGRLVFHYVCGSTFTGDIQIAGVSVGGSSFDFTTYTNWTTAAPSTSLSYAPEVYVKASFAAVSTSTAAYGKFIRRSGGTPSGSTGVATAPPNSLYYLYYEASSTGQGKAGWVRSPEITLSNDTLSFYVARYGSSIGTLRVFWEQTA